MYWVVRSVAAFAALALAVAAAYVWMLGSLPDADGDLTASGIAAPLEITRDRHGVPHVEAKSRDDALFGLGYAHAEDRLWQMEVSRRVGAGRLSEVLGRRALALDRIMRVLGTYRSAQRNYASLDPGTRRALDSYAAGVNGFIATRDMLRRPLPPEFILLGVRPEPWMPEDSLVCGKTMAFDLSVNMREELLRAHLAQILAPDQVADIYPSYPHPDSHELGSLTDLYASMPWDAAWRALDRRGNQESGSNNWVVAGGRSATGKPILANDPHLRLVAPSVWYLAHVSAPGINVIGATLPGIPAVILGRNDRLAWGSTNTYGDVQDVFVERLVEGDPSRYLSPDGATQFEVREEVIRVRGELPVRLPVRRTRHGPVISDLMPEQDRERLGDSVLAVAWTALHDRDASYRALLGLQGASDRQEFEAALRDFVGPQQNMVYADVDGNVGFVAPAWLPRRHPANRLRGAYPSPGWDALYDWNGFLPFEELPRQFNPPGGLIATANNPIVGSDYPHHITFDWEETYRIRRIRELMSADPAHSIEDARRAHGDGVSPMAQDFLGFLLDADPLSDRAAQAIAMLSAWDGDMDANRPEPLIFSYWYRQLESEIYADEFGSVFAEARRNRPTFIWNVLNDRQVWCDNVGTATVEACDQIVSSALAKAVGDLAEEYGSDMSAWRWGDAHYARMRHLPFTVVPLVNDFVDVRIPVSGGPYTVNRGNYDSSDEQSPFAMTHGASFRAIYDLNDLDRSVYILVPGQSGNPLSPDYRSFVEPWRNIEYIPMTTDRSVYTAGARGTVVLSPAPSDRGGEDQLGSDPRGSQASEKHTGIQEPYGGRTVRSSR